MNDANNAGTLAPKVRLLLQMLQSANGQIDASDHRNSLLNYFCDDNGRETDTFNLAIKFGFIRVTHDSHFETSTAYLIDVGREAALSTPNEREAIARAIYDVSSRWIAPNFPKGWKPRSFEELEDIERRLHFAYADAILAVRLDEAAIRKDEREKFGFVQAMDIAERGFETWAAKDHNAKWVRRIDGPPIKNDLLVNIAEAFRSAIRNGGKQP